MKNANFYSLVKKRNIEIFIPRDAFFSFATSPYHAHQHGVALDIYGDLSLKNFIALSPIEGQIMEIKSLRAPSPKFKDGISREYVTLIKNPKNEKLLYKILHVKPKLNKGDYVEVGDQLGKTIKNGYFAPWSSPHIHLEVRSMVNPYRARGGKKIPLDLSQTQIKISPKLIKDQSKEIPIKIESVHSNYYLSTFPSYFYAQCEELVGLTGRENENYCLLDGGIPIYKTGIALFAQKYSPQQNENQIYLGKNEIGTINQGYNNFYFYKFKKQDIYLNQEKIRGISLFLGLIPPLIKLIPLNKKKMSIPVKSFCDLRFSPKKL